MKASPLPLRAAVAAALLTAAAGAQRFSELPLVHVPAEDARGNVVAAGDIDGDLDVDLVFPREFEAPLVYRNQGGAMFLADTNGMPVSGQGEIRAAALLDVDGDGDLDLVATRHVARPTLWRNHQGVFTDVTATQMPNVTSPFDASGVLGGDIDGDGDLDLLCTGTNTVLLRNVGGGTFANATASLPSGANSIGESALADADGDGDLDLLGARRYWQGAGRHLFWANNGSGVFVDQSAIRMPAATHQYGGGGTVAVGDVDGDGDLDLVAPQHADNLSVLRNSGDAMFTTAEPLPLAGTFHCPYECFAQLIRLADVDGDGDLDVVCVNGGGYGHHLFLNDGSGAFTPAPAVALPQCRQVLRHMVVVDVDLDGDVDIVQATPKQNWQSWPVLAHSVLLNDGRGRFVDPASDAIAHTVDEMQCAAAIDCDRDGLLDVIRGTALGSLSSDRGVLWIERNLGSGRFVEAGRIAFEATLGIPRLLAVGDVDGDGWNDLHASLDTGANLMFRNLGGGQFALHGTMPATTTRASAAEFADVDGDGDLDLITARLATETWEGAAGRTSLWRNDGSGNFLDVTAGQMPPLDNRAGAMAVFDLEDDGDPDVYVGLNWSPQGTAARLYVNDGAGTFTNQPGRLPPGVHDDGDAAVAADFDRDGFVDLLVGEGSGLAYWRGTAAGTFVDASAAWTSYFHDGLDLRVADFDLDGWPDVYPTWSQPRVIRNTGTSFQAVSPITATVYPGHVTPRMALVADFDDDGDADIVYANSGFASAQWNLARHVAVSRLAQPGTTLPIHVYSRPGQTPAPVVAAVATSIGGGLHATPFGNVRLDLLGALDFQVALLPAPAGVAELGLAIPPWHFLQGTQLTIQALLFGGDAPPRLTNAVTTTIR
jgi:hypothetical protein